MAFDVDVCATESVLTQETVVPAATSSRSGLNAVVVNVDAPLGIETEDDGPDGVGVGVGVVGGVGDEYPLPHAIVTINGIETTHKRNKDFTSGTVSFFSAFIFFCPFPLTWTPRRLALAESQALLPM